MPAQTKAANVLLWIAQSALAALFLFAGGAKLAMNLAPVAQLTGLPAAFLQFIAVAELLGALGLILPGALGIRRELTPFAALGLVGVMTGAVTVTVATQGVAPAALPAVVAILLVTVLFGRRRWARYAAASPRGVHPSQAAPLAEGKAA